MAAISMAEKYDTLQVLYQCQDGLYLIDKITLRKGFHILDLGCGTGYLSNILADRVGPEGKVIGVDLNKERLHYAKRKYADKTNLTFVEGNSEDFPPGPYDVIFSNHVLHWIEDKESTFRNVYENLKVGGRFAFLCSYLPGNGWWDVYYDAIGEQLPYPCLADVYEQIVNCCGFKVEFKSVNQEKYTFASVDAYIEWILATNDANSDKLDTSILKNSISLPQMDYVRITFVTKKVESHDFDIL